MVELGEDVEDKPDLADQPSCEHALVENFPRKNPILDTIECHHITGNLKFIYSFICFSNPVLLKIATNYDWVFVVGAGDLNFEGVDGDSIILKGVLYSNAQFTYDQDKKKWIFPHPVMPNHSYSS
ncbi:hypothetical protein VP01_10348g1 [Puccinia sorghi]|uniref:Uncharacterized protein n=1 Tax=Puccinia sorghi TaxID=27349 RepID=A0A0L6VUM1_9BASI|nr:hypothetical protein VP01_10348g1 [Puccinia sorghi]